MMRTVALGIDIGGTKIRGIVFDGRKILRRHQRLYRTKPPSQQEFFTTLFDVIDTLRAGVPAAAPAALGIGTAGIVAGNTVFPGPNLTAVAGKALWEQLRRRYRMPIKIENDVKTAALAEWNLGAGTHSRSMVMITLGSGLGGAYIKEGMLQRGTFDSAYEMGFLMLNAERARSGAAGDFEWYGSEKFFLSRHLDPIEAEKKARNGNQRMRRLWQEYGEYLGIGIASIINILEPEVFVIGGGISHAWPLFASSVRKTAKQFIISPLARRHTKIVRAKLGRDAGAIGAALLALE